MCWVQPACDTMSEPLRCVGALNVQVVSDMLQQDVEEAGRAIAGRVREHGGDASVHAAAASSDGRSLEDRAHAALSSCPRFVLLDFKYAVCHVDRTAWVKTSTGVSSVCRVDGASRLSPGLVSQMHMGLCKSQHDPM